MRSSISAVAPRGDATPEHDDPGARTNQRHVEKIERDGPNGSVDSFERRVDARDMRYARVFSSLLAPAAATCLALSACSPLEGDGIGIDRSSIDRSSTDRSSIVRSPDRSAAPVMRHLEADPGPPPHERPPRSTLWQSTADGWIAAARVVAVSPSGRAWVDVEGALVVEGRPVAVEVQPAIAEDAHGRVAFARGVPPESDVWLWEGGIARPITRDGMSDRPFMLPDGVLIWVTNIDGRARWVRDGKPMLGSAATAPPPARPQRTRWDEATGAVVYDAGDREWSLWPHEDRAVAR
jgi:hypothetical protein